MRTDAPTPPRERVAGSLPTGLSTARLTVLLTLTQSPLLLLWGAVPAAYQFGGVVATPLIFGLGGLALLCFAVAYGGMAGRMPAAGGLRVFVAKGLGAPIGLGAGVVALLSYVALMSAMLVYFGGWLTGLVAAVFGVRFPMWFVVLAGVIVIAGLGTLRLPSLLHVLIGFAAVQVIVVVAFDVLALANPPGGRVSVDALDPTWLFGGSFSVALCFAVTSFIGPEVGVTFADEVRSPRRTVPRAVLLSYGIVVALVVMSSWAMSTATGPLDAVPLARGHLELLTAGDRQPFMSALATQLVGGGAARPVVDVMTVALITGAIASVTTISQSVARQVGGLARDGILPTALPRPARHCGLAAAGVVALVVGLQDDPATAALYLTLGAGLGVAGVLALTALATAAWFLRNDDGDSGYVGWEGRVVAAGFAAVVLAYVVVYSTIRLPELLPGDADLRDWVFPLFLGGGFTIGLVWSGILSVRRGR
ncbi:APC family permease [Cryptosporangium sp. NPDC048952]|uniref:APC family permease n=1 Tax=Cryptosporangium sp. NPDC048952 TaxID=3363961 RepID=UPI00371DA847